jgi:pimeloyl-ACP methyl ester carboxylesterase
MTLPALVLIHGAEHAADCWDLTIAELAAVEPALRVLAVDLPGRRGKPGDLTMLNIAAAVESVVNDIDEAGLGEVVIVGHSLAGVTLPSVAAALGSTRVREMIFVACFVPSHGAAAVDAFEGPLSLLAPYTKRTSKPLLMPRLVARMVFCNGMTRAQRRFMMCRRYRDSVKLYCDKVDLNIMPTDIPRTWILTTRDRLVTQQIQNNSIVALGGVETATPIDTCHDVMVSKPRWLANHLLQRCRLRS